MNYLLSYNYCNLYRVEYSDTDITCISDNVLSEEGIIVNCYVIHPLIANKL